MRTGVKVTDTFKILRLEQVLFIPNDRVVTYTNKDVDYRLQKDDPNRVRITAGGNLIIYPGELTIRTEDITTSKIMWISVLSTKMRNICVLTLIFLPVRTHELI